MAPRTAPASPALGIDDARFVALPDCHCPDLPRGLLKLVLDRLSQDWQQTVGTSGGVGRNVRQAKQSISAQSAADKPVVNEVEILAFEAEIPALGRQMDDDTMNPFHLLV